VCTTRFWRNRHQMLKIKRLKSQLISKSLAARKPNGINRKVKIDKNPYQLIRFDLKYCAAKIFGLQITHRSCSVLNKLNYGRHKENTLSSKEVIIRQSHHHPIYIFSHQISSLYNVIILVFLSSENVTFLHFYYPLHSNIHYFCYCRNNWVSSVVVMNAD